MRATVLLSCVWLLLAFSGVQAQVPRWENEVLDRRIEPRLIVGGGLLFQAPLLGEGTLNTAVGGPGYGFGLNTGISFTLREQWGLDLIGEYARQGTLYWIKDTSCWIVTVPAWRFEGGLWRSFPIDLMESGELKVRMALGLDHQPAGERDRNEGTIGVRSKWEALDHAYLAFELSWWKSNDWDRWDLTFRYLRHLPRDPAYTAFVYQDEQTRAYTSTQDHIGFLYRYHIGLPRRPYQGAAPDHAEIAQRRTDTLLSVATRNAMARLQLWDDAEYDGDTVSVLLNGLVVLDHYELTHRRTTVKLPLREGLNDVVVVAHNEGRVPPNTARALLRTGTRRTQLVLKTFLDRNAAIRVTRF